MDGQESSAKRTILTGARLLELERGEQQRGMTIGEDLLV